MNERSFHCLYRLFLHGQPPFWLQQQHFHLQRVRASALSKTTQPKLPSNSVELSLYQLHESYWILLIREIVKRVQDWSQDQLYLISNLHSWRVATWKCWTLFTCHVNLGGNHSAIWYLFLALSLTLPRNAKVCEPWKNQRFFSQLKISLVCHGKERVFGSSLGHGINRRKKKPKVCWMRCNSLN